MIESGVVTVYQPAQRLGPWGELVRPGDIPGRHSAILGGLTGAILRFALVFFLLVSLVTLIIMLGYDPTLEEYTGTSRRSEDALRIFWAVLAVWHFSVGLVVVFSKTKFWQLQLLATIVNVPVVMCLVRYQQELGSLQYLMFGYLDAWLIFLLARWRPTYKLVAFLNDEIHYYLID